MRDVYALEDRLLIVASDRISAFDYILATGIPNKGRILTQLSVFWFDFLRKVTPTHFLTASVDQYPEPLRQYRDQLEGRSMLVKRARMIGHRVRGARVPGGFGLEGVPADRHVSAASPCPPARRKATGCRSRSSRRPPRPRPATTRTSRSSGRLVDRQPRGGAAAFADSRHLLECRGAYAESRGVLIADTKFEFGLVDDTLILADEVLTPDSSRFWPRETYKPGRPAALLRQAVRAGLPGVDPLEQAAAGTGAAARGGGQDR